MNSSEMANRNAKKTNMVGTFGALDDVVCDSNNHAKHKFTKKTAHLMPKCNVNDNFQVFAKRTTNCQFEFGGKKSKTKKTVLQQATPFTQQL
jgi:hypothetical protein